jgi:DNA-binding transcriptional MerR regulator
MKVGQLAAAAGASVQTIHYYERRKLLPAAQRLPSGYRDYPAESVRIVQLIKRMQEFGFTLRELGHFVRLLETQPHNPAERRACVEAKLAAVFLKHIPAEAATLYFKSHTAWTLYRAPARF